MFWRIWLAVATLCFAASRADASPPDFAWTWIGGTNVGAFSGSLGELGVKNASNGPGARSSSASAFIPSRREIWIFGGSGNISPGVYGMLGDLWRFTLEDNIWTWVAGPNTSNVLASYGERGQPSPTASPGGRYGSCMWYDDIDNNLWLFGGSGTADTGGTGYFGDLWSFNLDTLMWTWQSGVNQTNGPSLYPELGVPNATAIPPARYLPICWMNKNTRELWMYGGFIWVPYINGQYSVNDIWKYNIPDQTWTWVRGNSTWTNTAVPNYGQKGVSDSVHEPGVTFSASWTYDAFSDELWTFGGAGCGFSFCQDLWSLKLGTMMWTWHAGSGLGQQIGKYGQLRQPNPNNYPGGRRDAIMWIDPDTRDLWLFGGLGYSSIVSTGRMNDLWHLNMSSMVWTWVGGLEFPSGTGSFGQLGERAASNQPASRSTAAVWKDPKSNVAYMWGGYGFLSTMGSYLSDLWRFETICNCSGGYCDYFEPVCPDVSCKGLTSGWASDNATCGQWDSILPGRCSAGTCNTNVISRCSAESAVLTQDRPLCGSVSCRASCKPGDPVLLSSTTSAVCNLFQSCGDGKSCNGTGFCLEPQGDNSGTVIGSAIGVTIGVIALTAAILVVALRKRVLWRRRIGTAMNIPDDFKHLFAVKNSELSYDKPLGEGTYGVVYKGKYKGKHVAIKKLSSVAPSAAGQFFRESSLMMSVTQHPNVVKLIGMCQEAGNFSLVMEYLANGSCESFIQKAGKPFQDPELHRIAMGIASGMASLAAQNIVHRDLACRNVLLDAEMVPKVSDFGYARVVGEEGIGKTATNVGPIRWMSPESIRSSQFSEKSDVWSYGCVVLELTTGKQPFWEFDVFTVAVKLRDEAMHPSIPTNIPSWAQDIMSRCWRVDPADRPTFAEIYEILAIVGHSAQEKK